MVVFTMMSEGFPVSAFAAAIVEDVLPPAPHRQWTLSLPFRLRWPALKHPRVLDVVLEVLLHRLAAAQRREARRLGVPGRLHVRRSWPTSRDDGPRAWTRVSFPLRRQLAICS
ncbi:MAG: hypothetical protein AMXMBFR34_07080 [Myxococcaceae bacterium]